MQFKVPQFIDIEDKIFGPLTWKQALYLAGGAGLTYLSLKLLPSFLGLPVAVFFAGLALMLAFYKINDQPFIVILQSWLSYSVSNKLYIWKQPGQKKKEIIKKDQTPVSGTNHKLTEEKLRDIAWSLDVLDKGQQ
ncbi:MAG: PrgI family protein [bacterium]